MPLISRQGDLTSGHSCFPPTPPANWSSTVTVNGKGVILKGCSIVPHCCPGCHSGTYNGDHSVSIEGRSVQCQGDPVTCGDKLAQHSPDVSVDG